MLQFLSAFQKHTADDNVEAWIYPHVDGVNKWLSARGDSTCGCKPSTAPKVPEDLKLHSEFSIGKSAVDDFLVHDSNSPCCASGAYQFGAHSSKNMRLVVLEYLKTLWVFVFMPLFQLGSGA